MNNAINRVAIVGSIKSGGALQIIDALSGNQEYQVVALFDSDPNLKGQLFQGVKIVGSSENVFPYFKENMFDSVIIGIGGDLGERERVFIHLTSFNIPFANIIDRTVQIRSGVKLGNGNVILGGAYIGPNVTIGNNCYILNGISVQHDSVIGNHCYIATGAILGAYVKVGHKVRFEIGSGCKSRASIEDGTIIPAGNILS